MNYFEKNAAKNKYFYQYKVQYNHSGFYFSAVTFSPS